MAGEGPLSSLDGAGLSGRDIDGGSLWGRTAELYTLSPFFAGWVGL